MQSSKEKTKMLSQKELLGLALALGACEVPGWSRREIDLVRDAIAPSRSAIEWARRSILNGEDPLGDAFCAVFSQRDRRFLGATYTPYQIIRPMVAWAAHQGCPARVVDPGAGSGRFLVEAGRKFRNTELLAIEVDPFASILTRAHLATAGMALRSKVIAEDFLMAPIPKGNGKTLFLGNPPYVRHHLISGKLKKWLVRTASCFDLQASQLSGLHAYFFLAIAERASKGDFGVFVTTSAWLDANYGQLIRQLLTGTLGVRTIYSIHPSAEIFPGTQISAVITGFEVGSNNEHVRVREVRSITDSMSLGEGELVAKANLDLQRRWTSLMRRPVKQVGGNYIQLGEICRVHRGQATGANDTWIVGEDDHELPESVLFPSITRAKELIDAGEILSSDAHLSKVIDLPRDLDSLEPEDFRHIEALIKRAKAQGVHKGYLASRRGCWWSVGLREPAPILATYMARRPPVFVRNLAEARNINIAHGLYPRIDLSETQLRGLARFLSRSVSITEGRMYAGVLTKFEPKDMERLLVPKPEHLEAILVSDSLVVEP